MKDNAIATFFKLSGTLILAFLVWMTYWQGTKREDKETQIKGKVDAVQADLQLLRSSLREHQDTNARLAGQVEALKDLIASGGLAVAVAGPGTVPAGTTPAGTVPAGTRPRDPATPRPPAWLGPKVKALWGAGPDFLTEDPEPIPTAGLDTPGADPSGELRLFYGSQPSKINPLTASDAMVSNRIVQYCMTSIATPHAKNASAYTGDVAVRVQVNVPDYTEYTVFLRDDVYWHTPQVDLDRYPWLRGRHKLTAHDIKFTLDMIKHPDVDCEHLRGYYTECAGAEVIDDHCLVIRWNKPQYNSISFTLSMTICPEFILAYDESGTRYDDRQIGVALNEHWLYRSFKYVGSGPYYVAELNPDSHLLLRRNEDYFGERPVIQSVRMIVNNDNKAGQLALETREVHVETFQSKDWHQKTVEQAGTKSIFTDGSLGSVWIQGTGYTFIGWKNTHPIFRDKRVRKAMTLACDRPRFLRNLFVSQGVIATGTQPVDSPFTPKDLEPLPFDLAAARKELAAAGWADRDGDGVLEKELDGVVTPFRFTATVPSGVDTWVTLFEIFKEDLSKIGVKMTLEMLDWKIFVNKLDTREFECVSLAWASDGWESDLYQIWHSSQADVTPSSNFIEFRHAEADQLIVDLRSTFDYEKRLEMQHRLQRILHEEQPYTFLISARSPLVWWNDTVGGVERAAQFLQRPRARYNAMWIKAR